MIRGVTKEMGIDVRTLSAERAERTWLRQSMRGFDDFLSTVTGSADAAAWPLAQRIEKNILIYDGDGVRRAAQDAQLRCELMAEWVDAFLTGPGVIVIERGIEDLAVIDTASAIFETLIDAQKSVGGGGGDHFAKPGANDRIWNALEKHCLMDPLNFADYYSSLCIALPSEAWLGTGYQLTAQVNRVNPGGEPQVPHRDYHLGFMSIAQASTYPAHVHQLSPLLTLQGGIAHCDMPIESGPTQLLPFSQLALDGYLAFSQVEYQAAFKEHHVQLEMKKGDMLFFNPALMHAAGHNRSADIYRLVNLFQVSSAFGRSIETVNRPAMVSALYPELLRRSQQANSDYDRLCLEAIVHASAEGYAFPTNLDTDPPIGGLAPSNQAALVKAHLAKGSAEATFLADMQVQLNKQQALFEPLGA